ncbi:MAG: protein kinase [Blastocatellia bacterium]|nr:protein kinase [Blastocatellia bacterium]
MSGDFQKVKQIVQHALKLNAVERAAYLEAAYRDTPHLQAEIESLLAAHQEANSFLESPIAKGSGFRKLLTPPTSDTFELSKRPHQQPTSLPQEVGPGVCLKDRYVIERKIGQGGIGVVFLASDRDMHGRAVVVKVLHARSSGEWTRRKFLHESEALTRVNHPGVVKVLDRGVWEETIPFLVMEYIDGVTLRSCLESSGMAFDHIADIVRQVGEALEAVHSEGIFHRDLKPDNIMIQRLSGGAEQVKLIDFGIAKVRDPISADSTEGEMNVGTLAYMAPEQFETGECSAASDMYALGVVLHEMVTGKKPQFAGFEKGARRMGTASDFFQMRVEPLTLRPDFPPEADSLLKQALAYLPQNRPQSARSFGLALARILLPESTQLLPLTNPHAPLSVEPVPPTQPVETRPTLPVTEGYPFRFNRRTWLGFGLVAGLGAAVGLGVWFRQSPPPPPPNPSPTPVTVERIRYYLEIEGPQKSRQKQSEAIPLQPETSIWLHFLPTQSGYLYLYSVNERNQILLFLTGVEAASAPLPVNTLRAGADFQFPSGVKAFGVGGPGPTTITAIFSTEPLTKPAFFNKPPQTELTAQEIRELIDFRAQHAFPVQKEKPLSNGKSFFTILKTDATYARKPLVFDIVLQHKQK